jgi:hypothetical protein
VIVYTEIPSIQSRNPYSPRLNGFYLAGWRRERIINGSSSIPIPDRNSDELPAETAAEAGGIVADDDGKNGGKFTKLTRSRGGKNVIFRVFPEEHADIARRASEAGLTISEFIRRVTVGHATYSRYDYDVLEKLVAVHADMNRLGNLFKMALGINKDGSSGTWEVQQYERMRLHSTLASIESTLELLRNHISEFKT